MEERSCPTPIPDELFICAQCNIGFLSEEIFKEHEQSMHSETELLEKIKILEQQLYQERCQHKNSMEEINSLKSYNDTLETMKVSLEAQIEQLQKDIPESVDENKVLKNIIEEKDKLIKKNCDKHKQEVNEFKRQEMLSKENLRAAIKEREVLRENDRILLNTFDMMKKYIEQINEHYSKNKIVEAAVKDIKCEKCVH